MEKNEIYEAEEFDQDDVYDDEEDYEEDDEEDDDEWGCKDFIREMRAEDPTMFPIEDPFDEEYLQDGLEALIIGAVRIEELAWEDLDVCTYDESDILTDDKGLVIRLPNGREYQVTIVRSR